MEKSSNKKNTTEEFLRYAIAQRAILNGIKINNYEKIEMKNIFSKIMLLTLTARLNKLMFSFKIYLRDNILKGLIKEKIILIGTGGHAKVVVDAIRAQGKYEIVGCTTSDTEIKIFEQLRVFGTDEILPVIFSKGITKAFVAIGDNNLRRKISTFTEKIGFSLVNVIHPKSCISPKISMSSGTCIMAGAIINSDTIIGKGTIINTNSSIDHDCYIEDWTHIAPGSSLAGNVNVGTGSLLGVGTVVIPRISIGNQVIIGAGSVVVSNIPSNSVAYGIPAKLRDSLD